MFASLLALALAMTPTMQEAPMIHHARGTFDVNITPVAPLDSEAADAPGRMLLAKTFHGGIEGSAEGQMLATMGPEQSGAYAALERVRATVDGRTGAFALLHRGVMDQGAQDLSIIIVPGSGAGDLTGITGVFHLTIEGGEHRYDLEYTLPES